ncbi:MAG: nucleotide pyrophosphatase/phosphodiesterase family protein [Ornithinimicrobium sp.]
MTLADWDFPPYAVSLADVLPAVLASIGHPIAPPGAPPIALPGAPPIALPGAPSEPEILLPPAHSAVVALIDGLGANQLQRRSGHAPFLRRLNSAAPELRCGFPSTTATSLTSFGTGLAAGQHGVIGTLAPTTCGTELFSHLTWEGGPDPAAYQPAPTFLQAAHAAGVAVTTVSRPAFKGSGLTRAALHGGAFIGAASANQRVAATLQALRKATGPALVYLYIDEVDKAGHGFGPNSWQWGESVENADQILREVAAGMPSGTSLSVTADHGMIEAPITDRFDVAAHPDLAEGVRLLGGDPRAAHVFCEPGAAGDVATRWKAVMGGAAVILTRDEAIEAGWFGPVAGDFRSRIGDVVTAMTGQFTVLDSRACRPAFLRLLGHHGSMSEEETGIPLLHLPA